MKACVVSQTRTAEWNALVAREDSFSLTQSCEWGGFKERLGWSVYRVAVEDDAALVAGAQLLVKRLPLGFSVAYVPRGPVGRWTEDQAASLLFPELERLRAGAPGRLPEDRAAGPGWATGARIAGPARLPAEPGHRTSPRRPCSSTSHRRRRTSSRGCTRRLASTSAAPSVRASPPVSADAGDLPAFCELMRRTAKREGFAGRSLEYYRAEWAAFAPGDHCALLLAYHEQQLIAARTVYRFGRHAAEFHGGSVTLPSLHPNHLLVWRAIQWAKERGCTTYDMWGVPDEVGPAGRRPTAGVPERHDGLWGVYQFKRGFGARVVRYAGAYDLALVPGVYSLYSAAMVNRTVWERAAARLDLAARSTASKGAAS